MKKDQIRLYICIGILVIIVAFFPLIRKGIEKITMPKVEEVEEEVTEEKTELTEDYINTLHFPVMRSNEYTKDTYYTKDTFETSDMSNNDILLTAFLDIEDINITNNTVKSDYISLRVKNVLKKDLSFSNGSFYVPEYLSSTYAGTWNYNGSTYSKVSGPTTGSIKYYTLEKYKDSKYNDDDIIVYKYLGFAKIENNTYTIYSDPELGTELTSGSYTNMDDLNNTFNELNEKDLKVYKYTFTDTICSYNDYCLSKGEWEK